MKQILFSALVLLSFTACNSVKNESDKSAVATLKSYVDSINNANLVYSQENWQAIDNGYQERALKAEAALEQLSDDEKAELEASKASYVKLKENYQTNLTKTTTLDPKMRLRNTLFGEGKVGSDMQFAFANAGNLLSIYQMFVDVVDKNKATYSREDWDEIKVLYEALDTRKNEVEPNLAGPDNRDIAKLKVKFASIYASQRPLSKVTENSDAKE